MSQLAPFDFKGHSVRVVTDENGEPWFVAADVCAVLAISRTDDGMSRIDDDEKGAVLIRTPGGEQKMTAVNEPGLYSLILGSRKQVAKPFKKWVTAEVLPIIRKTGSYSIKPKSALELAREQVLLLEALEQTKVELDRAIQTKAEIGSRREATAMNTASQAVKRANQLEAELDRSKEYFTVKRAQMLCHGQRFDWRLLKSTGIEMGIDPIDVFDANYGSVKAYHSTVWQEAYAINLSVIAGCKEAV